MTATASITRPYRGLAAFDDAPVDALLFFGREREREIIVANLLASRFTVLYGPTGVGKSSLLKAGVAQQLRRLADVTVATFSTWSEDPTARVDEVIASATGETYLIFDQIEEYFLYHGLDEAFARRLPELVTEPGLRVNVLLGIREDSLAKLDSFKGRIPNLFGNYLRLDHLDRTAAREAIVGPLERLSRLAPDAGPFDAEADLVETVLDQVATGRIDYGLTGKGTVRGREDPGRIEAPFLQLVMERLWEVERAAGSSTLRLETLEGLGGAATIVRGHLDRALDGLDSHERELAAEMFGHLVTPSGSKIAHDTSDLARYAHAREEEVSKVLTLLTTDRIVRPVDGGSNGARYEIFHDVLASGVLAWRTAYEAEQELARERARRRRAIAIASVALVALAAVAAVALFALAQRERAQDRATVARARERAARALSLLTVDPEQSVRLASAAVEAEPTRQGEEVLRTALLASRQRRVLAARPDAAAVAFDDRGRVLVQVGDELRAYSRRGRPTRIADLGGRLLALATDRRLAAVGDRDRVVVQALPGGRVVSSIDFAGAVRSARFDADGARLAVVAADRAGREFAHVVRVEDGVRTHVLRHRGTKSVAFSRDGTLVATGSADDSARVWRLVDGRPIRTFSEHTGDVLAAEFSPDGKLLATASADSGVRVWRLADGSRRFLFVGHNNPTAALSWSPDGRFVGDGSLDRTGRILDIGGIGAGRIAGVLVGHEAGINAIAYSADGRRLVTVASDGTARVWDARAEHELIRVASHARGTRGAVFAPDGVRVLSWGPDGASVTTVTVPRESRVLETEGAVTEAAFAASGARLATVGAGGAFVFRTDGGSVTSLPHRGTPLTLAFARDGRVVTGSTDGRARFFGRRGRLLAELEHGEAVTRVAVARSGAIATATTGGVIRLWRPQRSALTLSGHAGVVNAVRFSHDGTRLLSAGEDGLVRVWSATTGALFFELAGHIGGANDATFSPSGRTIVTVDGGRQVRAWDADDGRLVRDLIGHFAPVNSVEFSADGRWLVTTSSLAAALWRTGTTSPFAYLRGHTAPVVRSAAFSPDGRSIVSAGDDGSVRLYRCEVCGGIDDLRALGARRLAASRLTR